ncbi:flippase [Vibrio algivorus]|uniref:flippase n=1 Tax=Vibrio algivorus TaxID=1667024 RepID=UPI0011AEB11C|nr:flippase [Vibrio algivorus]
MSAKKSVIWLLFEKVFVLGASFLVTALLARHLLPSAFGQYNYLISIVTLLGPFTAFGLNSIITRELLNRKQDTVTILGSSLSIRLTISLILIGTMYLASSVFIDPNFQTEFLLLLFANFFTSFGVFEFWVNAEMLNQLAAKIRTVIRLTFSAIKLVGIYLDNNLDFFIIVFALELATLSLSMYFIYLVKRKSRESLKFCKTESTRLIKQSWMLLLSGIAAVVYLKIDQIMLGYLVNDSAVGIYSVAARLSEVWYFVPVAIVTSYFPSLLNNKNLSKISYQNSLQKLCDLLFGLAFILALVITLFSNSIVNIAFGSNYADSSSVLVVHIWAGVFIFMRALVSKWILVENLLKFSFITQFAGAVINVAINWILIPLYGPVGAALATLISYACASFFVFLAFKQTRPIAIIMINSMVYPIRFLKFK